MTIEQFLTELTETKNSYIWSKESDGSIRGKIKNVNCWCCRIEFCPITAVNKKLTNKSYVPLLAGTAGTAIGLTQEDIISIVNAADKAKDETGKVLYDENLFNKLVQATGVTV